MQGQKGKEQNGDQIKDKLEDKEQRQETDRVEGTSKQK